MAKHEERMALETCKDCRFSNFEEYEVEDITYKEPYGVCRRFPPHRIDSEISGFPIVDEENWCGEFQKNLP